MLGGDDPGAALQRDFPRHVDIRVSIGILEEQTDETACSVSVASLVAS
jgi:hypothetical protein